MKRITIKDIAKALSLHHSTVSRALRDEKSIHPDTRKKVLAYAREFGYQLNRSALQLRGEASNVIGIVVPNIHHSFFSNFVSEVTNVAFQKGYVVSVFQSNESVELERQIIKALIQNNVAGVLASISMETDDASHFKALKKFHIPLVLFDRISYDLKVPSVALNNSEIVARSVEELALKGFNRIAYFSGTPVTNVFKDRQNGYRMAIQKLGLDFQTCVILKEGFTIENGKAAFDRLMKEEKKPDAIICDSHILMLAVIMKLKALQLKPAADFGLAGFTGENDASVLFQGILSMRQPVSDMADKAFQMLLSAMSGATTSETEIVFDGCIDELK